MATSQSLTDKTLQIPFNSFFGEGTVMKGILTFEGNLRFDGNFKGEVVTSNTLVVGRNGTMNASIRTGSLLNAGKIKGDISANKNISVLSCGSLVGNIKTPVLKIIPGAIFNGNCEMPNNGNQVIIDDSQNDILSKPPLKKISASSTTDLTARPQKGKKISPIIALILVVAAVTALWKMNEKVRIIDLFKTNNPDKIIMEGIALQDAGNQTKAVMKFREAASLNIDDALSHFTLASAFEDVDIAEDAMAEYRKAIALEPDNKKFLSNFLHLLIRKDQNEEAILVLKKLIAIDPDDLKSRLDLAILYTKKGEEEELFNQYSEIIKIAPDHEESINSLARMQVSRGLNKEAISSYRKLTELNNNNIEAIVSLGQLLFNVGYEVNAFNEFNKLKQIAPEHIEITNNAVFKMMDNNPEKAIEKFSALLTKDKENIRARYGLITGFTKKGYFSSAIKKCEKILESSPDIVPVQNRLAWLYNKKGIKLEKALELSQKTVNSNPESSIYLDTLSELYYRNGDKEKALELIQKAIKLSPDSRYYKRQLKKYNEQIL